MAETGSLHIHFSDCEIDVAAFELRRGGQACAVEPQVFELLLYLARNPDRLVTKSDLIENVWGGRIVSDSTLASRIKSARRAIGDDGEQQRLIRTVHGRGVRFIGEIREEREPVLDTGGDTTAGAEQERPQTQPAIAVLPFVNISGDPEQDVFADGLTEDIITDLARFRLLRVVARNLSFRYRGQTDDLKQVGRDLGVGYLVMGNLRRQAQRIRLTAELVDAATGHRLWSERFDRKADDIFAVADQLVRTVAATLAGRVHAAGSARARRRPPANLAAYECVLRAHAAHMRIGDPQAEAEMRRLYEQAVMLDASYGRAHAGLAMAFLREWYRSPGDSGAMLDLALDHAEKSAALDKNDSECQETLGWILLHRKAYDAAERCYRRALELNPNSPDESASMGALYCFLGRPVDGIALFQQAKQLDPYFDPTWFWHLLGVCYFNARRYQEAIAAFGHSASVPVWAQAYLAASQAMDGQMDQAAQTTAALAAAAPDFSAAVMIAKEPYKLPGDLEHLADGLRKAGLVSGEVLLPATKRPTIAVLPFANISGDPEQDYFADGLTEEIIADLASISALYVTPRNDAFAYKGQAADVQQAAKDLDVCYILDGSVRRMGDRVRIVTQLVDGRSGLHVWVERYDRPWEDIFALRDEISRGIVAALRIQLLPQELESVVKPPTNSAEAYQYYLMGRSFFLKSVWAKRALEVARQLFAKAIEIDANYARAYAGIANCDSYRLVLDAPGVSLDDILANSARAIELDPNLAEAHASKGLALYTSGRHIEANEVFEQAVRLGPELYEAHFFYARNCLAQGLHAKSARLLERAAELNSSDFRALGLLVDEYRALGRHDDSMAAARRCIGRLEHELSAQPDNACALAFGAIIQAEIGDEAQAEDWARRAIAIEPDDYVTSYNLGCTFTALRKFDLAMEWLKRASPTSPTSRRAFVEWMVNDSCLWPLRGYPEFEAHLARLRAETGVAAAVIDNARQPAIAVLPFANLSGDPDQDYFAHGLSEGIIAALSRLSALSVAARGAVFAYKGKTVDAQQVGRDLNIDHVLEGGIEQLGDRIRVTTRLLDGRTGEQLWADRYDRSRDDILALQNDITESIVAALKIELQPEERASVTSHPTASAEAYEYYMLGRSFFLGGCRNQQTLRVAREMFSNAISADASYARAYAGIANCDSHLLFLGEPDVTFEDVLANSERSLALEPDLPEALAAKGLAHHMAGRYGEAETILEQAMRNGPPLFEAHYYAGRNHQALGHMEQAAECFEKAAKLQPSDYSALGLAVATYRSLGREDKSLSAGRRCLERLQAEIAVHPDNACALVFGASVQADIGNKAEAEAWAARAAAVHPGNAVIDYNLACVYAAVGKFDDGARQLDLVFAGNSPCRRVHYQWMIQDASLWPLRGHPAFEDLVRRLKDEFAADPPEIVKPGAPENAKPNRRAVAKPSRPQPIGPAPAVAPDRPSIAVLPFENRSDDPDRLYFADAVVEQITAALARVRSFPVIARSATVRYRGQTVDPRAVAKELGVRYLLQGGVSRSGDRIRITTELVDADSGVHIWAERYDGQIEDIFDLQDGITESVVAAIAPTIRSAEIQRARRKRPQNLEAYDYVMRALPHVWALTAADSAEALRLTTEAIRLDPEYALANALAAWSHAWQFVNDWTDTPEATRREGLDLLRAALKLDADDPSVLTMAGATAMMLAHDLEMAGELIERALRLDPNSAWTWIRSGYVHAYSGDSETALVHFGRAQRLSPFDPFNFNLYIGFALAHFVAGRYEQACDWAERGLRERPDLPWAYRMLAAAHPYLGNVERSNWAVAKLREINPRLSVARVMATLPLRPDDARNRYLDGLRRAGLPDESPALAEAEPAPPAAAGRPMIAVLPFDNLSGDPDQEYFADGLTEDIITNLSQVSGLAVTARNTVFTYKRKPVDVQRAARELRVGYILEGAVRRTADRIRITGQLVDGRTGQHVWAERYDRDWRDIFALQDEISQGIVAALKVKLLPQELAAVARPPSASAEAYQYYLMGRSFFLRSSGGPPAMRIARQKFARAIEIDPGFARAFAGIANCDSYLICMGDPGVSVEDVLVNSEQALAMEPDLAEAQAAKGLALYTAGRHREADAALAEAVRLGPDLFEAHFFAGRNFRAQGQYERAAALFERAAELQPNDFRALGLAVNAYRSLGRSDERRSAARRCLERVEAEIALQPDNAGALAFGAAMLAELGDAERADEWIARAGRIEKIDSIANYNLACACAVMGKHDAAIERLLQIFADPLVNHRSHIEWMKHDSSLAALHGHPAFEALLARLEQEIAADPGAGSHSPTPTSEPCASAVRPSTTSVEAYQCYLRGRAFLLKGVWGKRALEVARQQFAKAIALDPRYALAYAAMASLDCYRLLLDLPDASLDVIAAHSAQALELGPDLPEAHAAVGLLHATACRREEASAAFERAVALGPDSFEAHFFAARHCLTEGEYDKAARLFERAALLNTDDFGALGLLVDVYRALGQPDASVAAARRCIDRLEAEVSAHPDNGCALAFGAIIQAEAGNESVAEEWAHRAISIEPDNVVTNYNLACAFGALGKVDTAMDWLRRAIPDSPASVRALVEWMQHDSSLEPLRGLPAFDALMGRLQGASESERPTSADLVKA
jgi:TolB-like protein/predicted Zn-dependent protease